MFKEGQRSLSGVNSQNPVTIILACQSANVIQKMAAPTGNMLLGGIATSDPEGGIGVSVFNYVAAEFIKGIDAGKTVPQIQEELDEYFAAQAGQFKITITVRAPEPAEQPSKESDATRTNSPIDDDNRK